MRKLADTLEDITEVITSVFEIVIFAGIIELIAGIILWNILH